MQTTPISGDQSYGIYKDTVTIDEAIRNHYGTCGEEILEILYNGIRDYNNSHETKMNLRLVDGDTIEITNVPPNFSKTDLEQLFAGHSFCGWTPVIKRSESGSLVLKLEQKSGVPLHFFSAKVSTSRKQKKWWKKPKYTLPNFFEINQRLIKYFRKNENHSISKLLLMIQPPSNAFLSMPHHFNLPEGLPADFIPLGRIEDGLRRDEMFYKHAKITMLKYKNAENTIFFNYTGHQGGVATALAEQSIPLYWQLDGNERIINSLQDWIGIIANNSNKKRTCAGIMLEPNHGLGSLDASHLPKAEYLQEHGITNIIVFSENRFGRKYSLDAISEKNDPELILYLQNLEKQGFKITVIGLEHPQG